MLLQHAHTPLRRQNPRRGCGVYRHCCSSAPSAATNWRNSTRVTAPCQAVAKHPSFPIVATVLERYIPAVVKSRHRAPRTWSGTAAMAMPPPCCADSAPNSTRSAITAWPPGLPESAAGLASASAARSSGSAHSPATSASRKARPESTGPAQRQCQNGISTVVGPVCCASAACALTSTCKRRNGSTRA